MKYYKFNKVFRNLVHYTDGKNIFERLTCVNQFFDSLFSNSKIKVLLDFKLSDTDLLNVSRTVMNNRTGKEIYSKNYTSIVNDLPSLRLMVSRILKENRKLA